MESLDLAVGLGAVRPGPLRDDVECSAGVSPGVGAVGRPVVGQDTLHDDPAVSEPGHSPAQHTDGCVGLFVGTDLGLGQAGVIVNDRVDERGADPGPVALTALAGPLGCLDRVALTLLAAEEFVPAAVGDVGELGDIDTDQ